MKIVLIGYMGSGKSTVGRKLAERSSFKFVDLDDYIETAEGISIPTIFSEKGEIYFRKKEHQYLQEVLQKEESFVLATGGGTPCYGNNMAAILKATQMSYYLKLSLPALVQRLEGEKAARPLIKNIPTEELPEFIGKHLFERSYFYNQAHHVISCDGKGNSEIVSEIAKLSV
ncbi:shikimate kinase [Aggregatimonas sangjinii]|uniref:Shikimate kinase n=1 Tax=Aggregatimonas sangjinii TaxID=2583587 RepID=A0A5B7SPR6_9FLAO|nr:shikimate kinase [Aggregatimonas sangjinii]QCX00576.1 shikimate kinase [Aggregatimonas sangjinii]